MSVETAAGLQVEEVTSVAALEALWPEWDALWEQVPSATPFQSPAWLIPWWRHIGEGRLWTLAVREGGRLVGILPQYVYTAPGSSERQAFLLGIATTDYLDALFAPGREAGVAAAVLSRMDARRDAWDVCDWQQLRPGSPLLEAPAPPGWREQRSEGEACPVLPLDGKLSCVPATMRKNLRYYRRRAERAGTVAYEAATADNWEEIYSALLGLHEARWRTRQESGVLADPGVQQAHRESILALIARDLLRMVALRLDGRTVAVLYGLIDRPGPGRRAYYYLGGFDPEVDDLSPGTLLVGYAVEQAAREGAISFDLLRGREGYKYLWGARDEATHRRRLWRP